MTSIPVSRTEFMKLISRVEQLEAEVSLLRNRLGKENNEDRSEKSHESEESDDEKTMNVSTPLPDKSHRRLLTTKRPQTTINFQ